MTTEYLHISNEKVVVAAGSLLKLFSIIEAPSGDELARARWHFASALMQHLALKERYLYSKLETDLREDVCSYFAVWKRELLDLFALYTERTQEWSTTRAVADWTVYRSKAHVVISSILARLRREETELVPYAVSHQIDIGRPSAVTTNWTRKAFDLKGSVETR